MSAHHHAADCSQVFDADDTTETRTPDAEHREALELLGYAATGRVRLTVREWRQVTRVAGAIRDARNATSGLRSDELPRVGHLGRAERGGGPVTGEMGAA